MKTASLSGSLLVRKGAAGPSGYAHSINGGASATPVQTILTGRPQGAAPPPALRKQTLDHNGRVRLSVRFDQDQHTRLQLASVHTKRSMRDLIASAVDHYLRQIAPNVRHGACACLARSSGNG